VPTEESTPTQARVVVETQGRHAEAAADTGVPAADLALQRDKLRRKFLALATPVLGVAAANRLADAALSVHELTSVEDLLHLASTG
jgi:hypothetical protein